MKLTIGYLLVAIVIGTPVLGCFGAFDTLAGKLPSELPLYGWPVVVVILGSFFSLWFWMLGDFFSHKDTRHRLLVGFSLIFFNWLASVLYFFLVVVPRERRGSNKALPPTGAASARRG